MTLRPQALELLRVELPLRTPFRTAHGTLRVRDALIVHLLTDGPDGWGECAAPSTPGYSDEDAASAHLEVRDRLWPALVRGSGDDLVARLAHTGERPMARAALEMALLDAELRAAGQSLAVFLGGERRQVACGVVVPMLETPEQVGSEVGRRLEEGYQRIKLKIAPGWDTGPLRAARAARPDAPLSADANGSYEPGDTAHLRELDVFGLVMLEQPLARNDLEGHARLAAALATPICLDESIDSPARAEEALALRACAIVNVKPSRMGGLLEARQLHDLCAAERIPAWCGGMHETAIGRAALLALASLPGFTLPADISPAGRHYTTELAMPPAELVDGCIAVPQAPGLGVEVDPTALAGVTRVRELLRA